MLITGDKTPEQIAAMRECGKMLATVYAELRKIVTAGMSELEADAWVGKRISELGAEATYHTSEVNFPGNICISVNDELVHSLPTEYVFQKGDVVSFDLVIAYKGMKTDSAFTMVIDEEPRGAVKHLLKTTEQSLYSGIDAISGVSTRVGAISSAIEQVLTKGKLGIVRNLVGHGIGAEMHMKPEVPNFGKASSGPLLQPGDTIAIEPMASLGGEAVITESDGWTISMKDGSLGAHFEHTVLITETGAEILTSL
ncbi:type I methionyl aminopeptidase [Candidatus Saccharibacteria bacterium 32-49-10]|nr:MAG: type I methionyl aminopeptidase [Candidatus Saccharibacteria bacterium 32-49-10]